MRPEQSDVDPTALVDRLRALPAETEWVEFKIGNHDPKKIGELASAVSNGARLADCPCGYIVWGVADSTHDVVGTEFNPSTVKQGNEPLEFWLSKAVQPDIHLRFREVRHPQGRVVLLEVPAAHGVSTKFKDIAYIRIGSATPKLSDHPGREAALNTKLQPFAWEQGIALAGVMPEAVLDLLDHDAYFTLTRQPLPETRTAMLARMAEDHLIAPDGRGGWSVLNLGAILLAKKLERFPTLSRKALRIIQYDGLGRQKTKRQSTGTRGYASGFEGALSHLDTLLPAEERIATFREEQRVYPAIALRELLANALIHQDMTIGGTGPMVEVFDDRLEISNPGKPITDFLTRLFAARPRSRNERLAALMRKMRICEEQGSGLEKIIAATEERRLPAPRFVAADSSISITLFSPRRFADLTRMERVEACYQHAALMFQTERRMTNASLRERFGIEERNAAQVSRVIKDALTEARIRPADPERPKAGAYVPFWA
ncbi:ATP-binding protein [Falsiroseomonas oryziterrae]|uniref:ATP-binding protein n=1 Tax=Falsiroseomonas oryziterrae TaxID=2911368 RepID=UPI001F28E43F|nr:ATP-binding protein [Roseomonas sp. NPKOSM-4]